jgi:hypothetical protein
MSAKKKTEPVQEPVQVVRDQTHECSSCGRNGYYGEICSECQRPIDQARQYTLSELRTMSDEEREAKMRQGRPSGAPPRIVHIPGSQ